MCAFDDGMQVGLWPYARPVTSVCWMHRAGFPIEAPEVATFMSDYCAAAPPPAEAESSGAAPHAGVRSGASSSANAQAAAVVVAASEFADLAAFAAAGAQVGRSHYNQTGPRLNLYSLPLST